MDSPHTSHRPDASVVVIDRTRLFLEVCLIVLGAEGLLMLLIPRFLPSLPSLQTAFVDTIMLAAIAGPAVYWRVHSALDRLAGPVPERRGSPEEMLLPIVVAMSGMLVTAGVLHGWRVDQARQDRMELEAVASRLEKDVASRFDHVLFGLRGTRGLMEMDPGLGRAGFRRFWSGVRVSEEFPGVRGFGVIRQIPRRDSLKLLRQERDDDGAGFAIRSTGPRPDLMVITRIEPLEPNRAAWGYDVGSEPVRREAMEAALRMGRPNLTAPIALVQDGRKRAGFLYILPIHGPLGPGDSLFGRGTVVYAPIVAEELLGGIDSVAGAEHVLRLWEGGGRDSSRRIHGDGARDGTEPGDSSRLPAASRRIPVGDRILDLEVSPRRSAPNLLAVDVFIGVGGGILSLLMGAVIWLLGVGRRQAEGLALSMTEDLRSAKAEAEDALRYSRSFLETIHAQTLVSVTDREGHLLEVNDSFCDAFGYARKDLVGKTHRVLNSGTHGVEFWTAMWSRIASGRSWRGSICNRARNGSMVWLDTIVAPILGADGSPVKYLAISTDITERKAAERVLQETMSRLQAVLDSATEISVICTDLEGKIVLFNRGAENLLGWTSAEMVGKRTPAILHDPAEIEARGRELTESEGERIEGFRVFVHHAAKGAPETRQWTYVRKDGSRFPVSLVVTAVKDASGDVVGFMGVGTDISQTIAHQDEMRKAVRAAEAANLAKSTFLANMSHEIRTPMSGVLGMLQILLDADLPADQRANAEGALASAESLLAIINDILDFSKIEAGKLDLEVLPFDLGVLLDDLSSMFAYRARERSISFTCMASPDAPLRLVGDPGRLRQVLTNLIGNAMKFTAAGEVAATVDLVELDDETALLRFAVRDTGIGIPPERLGTLFHGFDHGDASIARRYGGTGLGLAISSQLVEMMGGSIEVESEVGRGSTFRFTSRFRVRASLEGDSAPTETLQGVRVLLVDGNEASRIAVREQMLSWGMDVEEAATGVEGLGILEEARDRPIRVVVLDARLPDLDGIDFGRLVQQGVGGRKTVLAVLATVAERGDARRFELAGFSIYLPKPVRSNDLSECLVQALGRDPSTPGQPILTRHLAREQSTLPRFKARALLVEDNAVNQKVARSMLQKLGVKCDVAENGREALRTLALGGFDVVLMDLQMPVMDGLESARRMRAGEAGEIGTRIPIVALTASALGEDQEACRQVGMNDYLTKPLAQRALADSLSRWLTPESEFPS